MKSVAGWIFGGVLAIGLLSTPAAAQGQSRDKVRLQILDQCVMTQSKPTEDGGAGPLCNCYAPKVVKLLTDEEVAKFRRDLPKRLAEEAGRILASCR